MKRVLIAIMLAWATICGASEEDYAPITAITIEAETTTNTFGRVVVSATLANGIEGLVFSSLVVQMKGSQHSVPQDQLAEAARVYCSTLSVSSEVGYPEKGIGPYLYIHFDGHDGTKQVKFCLTFDENGFVELKKEGIQQGR